MIEDCGSGHPLTEEEPEEWLPEVKEKTKGRGRSKKDEAPEKKPAAKRVVKPKEPKPKAVRKPRAPRATKAKEVVQKEKEKEEKSEDISQPPDSLGQVRVKEERQSISMDMAFSTGNAITGVMTDEEPSSSKQFPMMKKEEPEDDFTFDEPVQKKQKTASAPQGRPVKLKSGNSIGDELQMNWDPIKVVLAEKTGVEQWVCSNITQLLRDENTIPFIVRYRKELINHMDADAVRNVQLVFEELCSVAKKSQSITQTLKKEGVLNSELEQALRNCRSADELDHVYTPYKKGSKLSKARRAKQLGLEAAALAVLQSPQTLALHSWIKPNTEGLSTLEEVATGVEQILADMIAKDGETLTYIRSLCDRSNVTIHSTVSKTALKEQLQQQHQTDHKSKPKDISKFSLYSDFSCNVQRIQHHQVTLSFQTLAINRGENLKILSVKVNIPDWVKTDFCRWCVNVRWRPQGFARPELMKILNNAVEDSYKRLITPLLCRGYRTKLTTSAEKESVAMFVRNLRQRLLMCPVRGRVIMGVDPGYRHGCKLAILSPTSQILQTDVVYLHGSGMNREADKLRHLMLKHSCQTVVIGNGTACRETEAFFAELIKSGFFRPLDVSFCITDEAGASIYSVSPEAVKEMPDLDPNLRSAVSIGRRVQDPLAELVKIDPKHIGIGTYQPMSLQWSGLPQDHHREGVMWMVDHAQHCSDIDVVVSFINGHRTLPTGRCPQDAAHRTFLFGERLYNSEFSFHRFPVDPEVRTRWLTQIRRDDFGPLQSTRVCSRHFNTGDFVVTAVGKRKLNKGALPCLFAGNDYSMSAPRLNVWQHRPRCPCPVSAASDTDQEMEVQIAPDHDYSVTLTTSAMADALANENKALKRKRQELQHQLEASQLQSRFGLQLLAGSDEDIRFYTRLGHSFQHDVSQSLLRAALDGVVQECVSFVGVDINICSETLMRFKEGAKEEFALTTEEDCHERSDRSSCLYVGRHVAGLNAGRARSIAEWREKNGPFLNREQLKLVKGLGPKSFQQCAGFVRINPESVRSYGSGGSADFAAAEKPTAKKSKAKTSASISNHPNPLDQTCIHPESYGIAMRFLSQIGGSLDQLGSAELRQQVESSVRSSGLEALAQSLNTSPETLQLIVDGLTQPPGFDIRQDFKQTDFKQGIVSMVDLRKDMVLTGRVANMALFGAFVDIGVGRSGLIPKRYITLDKLPVDKRRRSLALGPGERVEVRVMDVDHHRNRISLDLIRVLREEP
ncbi:hypothetical protein NFI96_027067 [Prochilodus magdalenae]|nr:hypothetical protein NFI96_027067 [Prochilodus magdalenae]